MGGVGFTSQKDLVQKKEKLINCFNDNSMGIMASYNIQF